MVNIILSKHNKKYRSKGTRFTYTIFLGLQIIISITETHALIPFFRVTQSFIQIGKGSRLH